MQARTLREAPAGNGGGFLLLRRPIHPNPTLPTRGRRLSRIRLEFDGVNEVTANEALRLGAMKLPVTTRVVIREDW